MTFAPPCEVEMVSRGAMKHLLIRVACLSMVLLVVTSDQALNMYRDQDGLSFGNVVRFEHSYLALTTGEKIRTVPVKRMAECVLQCVQEDACVSMNMGTINGDGEFPCEILKKDKYTADDKLSTRQNHVHLAFEVMPQAIMLELQTQVFVV